MIRAYPYEISLSLSPSLSIENGVLVWRRTIKAAAKDLHPLKKPTKAVGGETLSPPNTVVKCWVHSFSFQFLTLAT